jgi:hypothetical protein
MCAGWGAVGDRCERWTVLPHPWRAIHDLVRKRLGEASCGRALGRHIIGDGRRSLLSRLHHRRRRRGRRRRRSIHTRVFRRLDRRTALGACLGLLTHQFSRRLDHRHGLGLRLIVVRPRRPVPPARSRTRRRIGVPAWRRRHRRRAVSHHLPQRDSLLASVVAPTRRAAGPPNIAPPLVPQVLTFGLNVWTPPLGTTDW